MYYSDTCMNADILSFILSGLENKYHLKSYAVYNNLVKKLDVCKEDHYEICELLIAINKCLSEGIMFSSRGRGFILKEMLKKLYCIAPKKIDLDMWKIMLQYNEIDNINGICEKIESIYNREGDILEKTMPLLRNPVYDSSYLNLYGVSERIFELLVLKNSLKAKYDAKAKDLFRLENVDELCNQDLHHIIRTWASKVSVKP